MSQSLTKSNEPQQPLFVWLVLALILSIFCHVLIFIWLRNVYLDYGPPVVDPVEPKRFHLEKVTFDPKSLEIEPQKNTGSKPQPSQEPTEIAPEQIVAFSGPLQAPSIPTPRLVDPSPSPLSVGKVEVPIEAFSALPLLVEGNLPQNSQALMAEASTAALAEASKSLQTNLAGGSDGNSSIAGVPGFEEVAELVKLRSPEALERPPIQPILIRLSSDVLFGFDSAELKPESEKSLQELAAALSRALKIQVMVEGHTDTVGEEDYNLKLSEARALAVATWLKQNTSMAARSIKSVGYGESRPIVISTGSIEQQSRNRRVEIRVEGER